MNRFTPGWFLGLGVDGERLGLDLVGAGVADFSCCGVGHFSRVEFWPSDGPIHRPAWNVEFAPDLSVALSLGLQCRDLCIARRSLACALSVSS